MKLFKRFSIMKKGIGAAALGLAAFALLFAFSSCENMTTVPAPTMTVTASKTLATPSFPEHTTDDEGKPLPNLTYAERYYTVSQGRKRKISLSWNRVEIARYYEIYSAQNINDNFVKVGETTKAEFEDNVAAGVTYYYKVRAVNSWGERSEFSSVVKGTTLATPVITEISNTKDEATNNNSATIFWYMGNVGIDTYAKNLVYEIHAFKGSEETVVTVKGWDEFNKGIKEEYTFENMDANTEYMYRVDAYLSTEQNDIESSAKVSKKTLALYAPVSPEFVATQGESVDGVKLVITLPSSVQVTENKQDYDFPVTFEIQRKETSQTAWSTIVSCLYYNGQTIPPATADAYKYKEGDTIEYFDSINASASSVSRGVKYDYRIISCMDLNFAKVNKLAFKSNIKSKESSANTAIGWAANLPAFKVKILEKNINPSNPLLVDSYKMGFEAAWDSMGMDSEYKFAVRQNKRLFASDNGGAVDTVGSNSWLLDDSGSEFFASIGAVTAKAQTLDLAADASQKGVYRYTLYIVSAKCADTSAALSECLTSVEAPNVISVDINAAKTTRQLAATDGWSDFVLLTWTVEPGVIYSVEWNKYDAADVNMATSLGNGIIEGSAMSATPGTCKHSVEAGYRYKYMLSTNGDGAVANDDGTVPVAQTLGKPDITFTANSYTDIKASFKQALAAERYKVVLGQANGFGGGLEFYIDKDGKPVDKDGATASYPEGVTCEKGSGSFPANLNLTISKPEGYDKANLAGKETDLIITSMSKAEPSGLEPAKRQNSGSKKVWTIGPAGIALDNAQTFDLKADTMKVSWKRLEGAAGYAVFRQRAVVPNGGTGIAASSDVYYVEYDASTQTAVMPAGENPASGATEGGIYAAAFYDSATGIFTLTDTFREKGSFTGDYAKNQEYLALGVPYTYTVLPVLASADKNPDYVGSPEEWKVPGADKTYEAASFNGVKMERYTRGYGLAVKASKAESSESININWEKPKSAVSNKATLLYRKKDSAGDWTSVDTGLEGASYEWKESKITDAYKDQALEFAVVYGDNELDSSAAGAGKAYVDSYLAGITELPADGGELKSVGYLFSLPKIKYDKEEIFNEKFNWRLYGYNNDRKVGGDDVTYTLTAQNLNYSEKDFPLWQYDKAGNATYKGEDWYDVTPSSSVTGTEVKVGIDPVFTTSSKVFGTQADSFHKDGVHLGLLRVLRDYQHKYTVTAKRSNGVEAKQTVTCCRKITDEEFAKCIALVVSDAIYQAGVSDGGGTECKGKEGVFYIKHTGGTTKLTWGTNSQNYKHVFRSGLPSSPSDDKEEKPFESAWTIKKDNTEHDHSVTYNKIYYLSTDASPITVTHDSGFASYQGSVSFEMGGIRSVTFIGITTYYTDTQYWQVRFGKDGSTICSVIDFNNNKDKFKEWFPFNIGESFDKPINRSIKTYTFKSGLQSWDIPVFEYSYDGQNYNEWWVEK